MSGDEARIREVIFDYLSGFSDLSTVRTKDVRNHIINTLNLPKDYFGGDAKEIMLSIISNYQIPLAVPKETVPVSKNATPRKAVATPSKVGDAINSRNTTPRPANKPKPIYHSSFEDDSGDEEEKQAVNRSPRTPTPKAITPKKRKAFQPVESSSEEEAPARSKPQKHTPQSLQKIQKVDEDYPVQDGERTAGRFSKYESGLIYDAATRYAAEQDIPVEELCTQFRKDDSLVSEKSKHLPFWRELKELLPTRTKMAIWHHTQRLLARTKINHGRFTYADKLRLQELSKIYGADYGSIAQEMGCLPDDAQQQLLRMKVRGLAGRQKQKFFSIEEDEKIVKALQEALGSPGVDILDLPTKRLPWTAVATILHNERLPIDYNRRYQILLRRAQGLGTSVLDCSGVYSQGTNFNNSQGTNYNSDTGGGNGSGGGGLSVRDRQIQLVDRLIDGGYEDESEVNWAALDREFNFYQTSSQLRWKGLIKMCPANDPEVQTMEERLAYLKEMLGDSTFTVMANLGKKKKESTITAPAIATKSSVSMNSRSSKSDDSDDSEKSGSDSDSEAGSKSSKSSHSSNSSNSSHSSSGSNNKQKSPLKTSQSSASSKATGKPSMKGAFTGPVLNPPRALKTNTTTPTVTTAPATTSTSTTNSSANKKNATENKSTPAVATKLSSNSAATIETPIVTNVDSSSSSSDSSSGSDTDSDKSSGSESKKSSVDMFAATAAKNKNTTTNTEKDKNKSTTSSVSKKVSATSAASVDKKAETVNLASSSSSDNSSSSDSDSEGSSVNPFSASVAKNKNTKSITTRKSQQDNAGVSAASATGKKTSATTSVGVKKPAQDIVDLASSSSSSDSDNSSHSSSKSSNSKKSVESVASERKPLVKVKVKLASPASPISSSNSSHSSGSSSNSSNSSASDSDSDKADSGAESDLEKIFAPSPAARKVTKKPIHLTSTVDTKALSSASDVKLALTQVKVDSDLSDDDSMHSDTFNNKTTATTTKGSSATVSKTESKGTVKAEESMKKKSGNKVSSVKPAPLSIDKLYAVDEDDAASSKSSNSESSSSESGSGSESESSQSAANNKKPIASTAAKTATKTKASSTTVNSKVTSKVPTQVSPPAGSHIDTGTQGSEQLSPILPTQHTQHSQLSVHSLSPLHIQLTQASQSTQLTQSSQHNTVNSTAISTAADASVTADATASAKKKKAKKSKKNKKRTRGADSSSEDSSADEVDNNNNNNDNTVGDVTADAATSTAKKSKKKRGARWNKEKDSATAAETETGDSAALTSPLCPPPIATNLPAVSTPSNGKNNENMRSKAHSPYSAAAALALASTDKHTHKKTKSSGASATASSPAPLNAAAYLSPVRPLPVAHYGGVSEVVRSSASKRPQDALQELAMTGRAVIGDSIGKTLLGGQSAKKSTPAGNSSSAVKGNKKDAVGQKKRPADSAVENSAQKKKR